MLALLAISPTNPLVKATVSACFSSLYSDLISPYIFERDVRKGHLSAHISPLLISQRNKCRYSNLAERRRSTPAPKEEEKVNEEQWPLREVVFVEDVKNVPVGKVSATQQPPALLYS